MDSAEQIKENSSSSIGRKGPKWRGLVLQLITVVIFPLSILLIITAFVGLTLHQQSMRELAAERDERTARSVANTLAVLIQQNGEVISKIAQEIYPGSSRSELTIYLSDAGFLLKDTVANIALIDIHGNQLAATRDNYPWESFAPKDIRKLMLRSATDSPIYEVVHSQENDELYLFVSAASPDRSIFAISSIAINTLIERSLDDVFPSGENYSVYVVTPDQEVIYKIGKRDLAQPLAEHPGVSQALKNQAGSTYLKAGNDEHIVAYSPVLPVGWALVIEEPWKEIASRMLRLTENAPLVLIPIVVLAVLALWFSSRYVVRPLQALETKAVELGWGNYQAIEEPVGGIEEIRTLQMELVHMAHKLNAAQKGLRDYIGAITLGQEDERRRLARELHDDTLQSLIALNQRLQLFQLAIEQDQKDYKKSESLQQIQNLAEQTIQELRRITRALRPIYLEDLGLVSALEMLAREIDRDSEIGVKFQCLGSEWRLPSNVEIALYRIAQEALNNVVKHSQASHIDLQIIYGQDIVNLSIKDNGKGFDVPESPANFAPLGHYGMLGMFERAEMISAKLQISSKPAEGSQVVVTYKINQE